MSAQEEIKIKKSYEQQIYDEGFKDGIEDAIIHLESSFENSRMEHDQMGRGGKWGYEDVKSVLKLFKDEINAKN